MGSDASREHLRGDGRRCGLLPLCHCPVNTIAQKSKKRGHTRKDGVTRTFAPDRIEYRIQISDISLLRNHGNEQLTPTQTSANLIGDFNFPPSGVGVDVGVGRYCSGRAAIALSVVSAILNVSCFRIPGFAAYISKDS
jgi:hypothetical protein